MNPKILRMLLILFLLPVFGCASKLPAVAKNPIPESARIGIVVDEFPNELEHIHIGSTMFGNAQKTHSPTFNIREYIRSNLSRLIQESKFSAVLIDLNKDEYNNAFNSILVSEWNGSIGLAANSDVILHDLNERFGVDAIVIISPTTGFVKYPYEDLYSVGSFGLFSHAYAIASNKYSVYANLHARVVLTGSQSINAFGSMRYSGDDTESFSSIISPASVTTLSDEVISKIELQVKEKINTFLTAVLSHSLSNKKKESIDGVSFVQ